MPKSMKAENPLQDSGGSIGVKKTPVKVLNYALFTITALVGIALGVFGYNKAKESAGMDEEGSVTMEVK